jgi:type II secretory pathway component PulF
MDSVLDFLGFFAGILIWIIIWMGPFCGLLWLGYHFLSLRMRRLERARLFLDLVEIGLKEGRGVEATLISVSRRPDYSLVRFHLLAAYLEKGFTLREGLEKVPQALPAQLAAMLRVGLKLGDLAKILPACRKLSRDAVSQTRGAINYLVAVAFIGFPVNLIIFGLLQIYVLPQFISVCDGMGVPRPAILFWLMSHRLLVFMLQVILFLAVWAAAFIYVGGPRMFGWLEKIAKPFSHQIIYRLPWRRKRLQRDFSAMLATLIDAGVPEPEALALAADCTDNLIFQRRAQLAIAALGNGQTLIEAVQRVDDTGEFKWRLANAMHGQGDFQQAIAGWNESLDAKAFQLEQATAQVVTTGMVLLNGALVGVVVVTIFSVLVSIIHEGVLW